MLAIPWIAVIAAGGVILLLCLGFLIHGLLARKRHQQFMQQSEQDLQVYHRARLSVRGSAYAHVARPPSYTNSDRDSQKPVTAWSPLKSEERIEPEVAPPVQLDESPTPPQAKRKKGLRDSIYGHSGIHAPKTRRQKKIDRTISLKDMSRSPLSAITELTDSTGNDIPMPVELPTERTPNLTPEKEPESAVSPVEPTVNWSLPINKRRPGPLSPVQIDTPMSLKRELSARHTTEAPTSPSKSSMSEAPDSPLPPLPSFEACKPTRAKRFSQMSTVTVGSSVLGPMSSSPEQALSKTVNSGMQEFDFGFDKGGPGRVAEWHSGGKGVTSVVPAFDFLAHHGSTVSDNQVPEPVSESVPEKNADWTPGPEFFFGSQRPNTAMSSVRDSNLAKRSQDIAREHRQMVGDVSPAALPPRPASVASSQPFRLDLTPSSRLSVSSTGSGRRTLGHRRQNCVRIAIPVIPVSPMRRPSAMIRRPSHISEKAEDSDEEPSPSPKKEPPVDSGVSESSISPQRQSARRSMVDANGSPQSFPNHGVLRSNARHADPALSSSSSDSGSPRPDSDIFWSHPSSDTDYSKKTDPFAYPNRWALMPTPPGSMALDTAAKLSVFEQPNSEDDSPILPSPCKPAPVTTTTTRARNGPRPLGPRQAPAFPSTNINLHRSPSKVTRDSEPQVNGPGSPTRRTGLNPDSQEDSATDLRESIALLRRMDSSGRRLNAKSNLWTVGETPHLNQNHEDWKQLNALWEGSRPSSVNSISTRTTPGIPTRTNSAAGPGMRKSSNPRTADVDAAASMFGSSKRRMGRPVGLDLNTSTVLPPGPFSGGSRLGSGSRSASPSRNSLYSVGNVSIWEDESISGDESPNRNFSRRSSSTTAVPTIRPRPPPRLESLPQLPPRHQDRRGAAYGLGITIPSLPQHKLPSATTGLPEASPTQKQLKARYFGSVDWDKEDNPVPTHATSPYPNSPTHDTSSSSEREKENIAVLSSPLSSSYATPPTATSITNPNSTIKSHNHYQHHYRDVLDPELSLDHHDLPLAAPNPSKPSNSASQPPAPPNSNSVNISREQSYNTLTTSTSSSTLTYNFPLPGRSPHNNHYGISGAAAAANARRKVSPAQQRLKDSLRERAASVNSNASAGNTATVGLSAVGGGGGGAGGGGAGAGVGAAGAAGGGSAMAIALAAMTVTTPQRGDAPYHLPQHLQQQQGTAMTAAGAVAVAGASGALRMTPLGAGGPGVPGAGAGAGWPGSAGSAGPYDRDGFLKDSPLEWKAGGGGGGGGGGVGASGGKVNAGMGRSYRRMQ